MKFKITNIIFLSILTVVVVLLIVSSSNKTHNETSRVNILSVDPEDLELQSRGFKPLKIKEFRSKDNVPLWNPSMIKDQNGITYAYRADKTSKSFLQNDHYIEKKQIDLNLPKDSSSIVIEENGNYKILSMDPKYNSWYVFINGYEDPKLFLWKGEKWCFCTYRSNTTETNNPKRKVYHKLIVFNVNDPSKKYLPRYKYASDFEKNWLPFEDNGKLYVVYKLEPFVVLEFKGFEPSSSPEYESYMNFEKISEQPYVVNSLVRKNGVGGSGGPIKIYSPKHGECYIMLYHNRYWYSRKNFFVLFKRNGDNFSIIGHSKIVELGNFSIEFGSSMIYENGMLICSFGINDYYCTKQTYTLESVLELFN